jgi:glycosyltransferase involved in cell wall biosynthesis
MKEKILVITSSFPVTGSKVGGGGFVKRLAMEMLPSYDVVVLTPYLHGSLTKESTDNIEINRFKFLPFERWYRYFDNGILSGFSKYPLLLPFIFSYIISQFLYIRRLVKEHEVSIIHAHWLIPQGLTSVLYKSLLHRDIRIVQTIHGSDLLKFNNFPGKLIKQWVINKISLVTVVSESLKEVASSWYQINDIPVIPMGVDMKVFTSSEQKLAEDPLPASLLFVGRLEKVKGINYLIEAMPAIIKNNAEITLDIVGEGSLTDNLRSRIRQLGMENNIRLHGFVKNDLLTDFYQNAGLVIMPSLSEGSPVVMAEAMACKGAILAVSNIAAFRHHIIDGENGFIFEERSPAAIAECIRRIYSEDHNYLSIRECACNYAIQTFDWEIVGEKYLSIFKAVSDTGGSGNN